MKTIKTGQTLTSRSICDHNCIFELFIIERKGNFCTIKEPGSDYTRRVKVRLNYDGDECLRPDTYSMCPTYKAID